MHFFRQTVLGWTGPFWHSWPSLVLRGWDERIESGGGEFSVWLPYLVEKAPGATCSVNSMSVFLCEGELRAHWLEWYYVKQHFLMPRVDVELSQTIFHVNCSCELEPLNIFHKTSCLQYESTISHLINLLEKFKPYIRQLKWLFYCSKLVRLGIPHLHALSITEAAC